MKPALQKDMKTGDDNKKAKFQDSNPDEEFKNLMERTGVKKLGDIESHAGLDPESGTNSSGSRITKACPQLDRGSGMTEQSNETIQFEENIDRFDIYRISLAKKFTDTIKKRKINFSKKGKKLKPGFVPDMELDLHGYTQKEAIQKIGRALAICHNKRLESLLIITGKGLNSDQEVGILRKTIWNRLKNNRKEMSFRFRWAPGFLGGKGAILVFF